MGINKKRHRANLNISKIHFNNFALIEVMNDMDKNKEKLKDIQFRIRDEMFKLQDYIIQMEYIVQDKKWIDEEEKEGEWK